MPKYTVCFNEIEIELPEETPMAYMMAVGGPNGLINRFLKKAKIVPCIVEEAKIIEDDTRESDKNTAS